MDKRIKQITIMQLIYIYIIFIYIYIIIYIYTEKLKDTYMHRSSEHYSVPKEDQETRDKSIGIDLH